MIAKAALNLAALWLCAVPTLFAQTEYTADGNPTALEEEIRWLVNRGRFNTARENETRSTTYTDVPATAPPLAPHHAITLASRHHSEDMARNNLFQHATIPGSAYYDPVTQPDPWDRMRAEGYNFDSAAENIAAGYGTAEAAYIGWWKSEGHRRNMYNVNHREIGNGYFYWTSSTYRHYYTMDLGRYASTHFFTDTLFHDANNDGAYDQNEGRSGLHILLRIVGTPHTQFDVSTPAGSFAIPIQSIPDGTVVQVFLANPTATATSLSLPRNYDDYSLVTLGPNQEVLAGSFVQPASAINLGFRDLAPPTPPLTAPVLASAIDAGRIQLRWNSQTAAQYQVHWTQDWLNWTTLDTGPLPGTGGELTVYDPLPPQNPATRFYRVAVQ
ncbi:MAG: hypothetical protein KJ072_17740 [Verrucomicrobia bacterium]|nr:hypothetical protein [Verrucomicrobiota bacterium]